ncbi:uncharacterized protein LOC126838882 [Adelges cooleyi]|uniref:uncharacterized protein LOC126838882 n=1 Tax=Adelges cooleyi TaxID=133065 RepID=UPI00217FB840|nr:uncharacterized protein LOC126838882 [Adelges cooleyi]
MCGAQSVWLLALCALCALIQPGLCPFSKLKNKLLGRKTTTSEVAAGSVAGTGGNTTPPFGVKTIGMEPRSKCPQAADRIHLDTPFYQVLTRDLPTANVEVIETPPVLGFGVYPKRKTTETTDGAPPAVVFEKSTSKVRKHYGLQ